MMQSTSHSQERRWGGSPCWDPCCRRGALVLLLVLLYEPCKAYTIAAPAAPFFPLLLLTSLVPLLCSARDRLAWAALAWAQGQGLLGRSSP